jgi:hypothetical protein
MGQVWVKLLVKCREARMGGLVVSWVSFEVLIARLDSFKERTNRGFGLVELPAGGVSQKAVWVRVPPPAPYFLNGPLRRNRIGWWA